MAKFEIGKTYEWRDKGFQPFKATKRTEKMVFVTNGDSSWRMLIRQDESGREYVVDSSVNRRFHDVFTSCAEWVTE